MLKLNEIKLYYKLEKTLKNYRYISYTTLLYNLPNKCKKPFLSKLNNEIYDDINTRSKNKIHITRTSHSFAQKCVRQNLPHTINNIPVHVLNRIKTHSIQRITNDIKNGALQNSVKNVQLKTAISVTK